MEINESNVKEAVDIAIDEILDSDAYMNFRFLCHKAKVDMYTVEGYNILINNVLIDDEEEQLNKLLKVMLK